MMFFKIFKYDLRNGLFRGYKKFIVAGILFLILCADFLLKRKGMMMLDDSTRSTFADFILYIFIGMNEYKPEQNVPFQFPALWILITILANYIVLYYPYNDLMSYGKQLLINSRSRCQWWLSKCCWVIVCVACYFILMWLIVLGFCLLLHIPISLQTSEYVYLYYTTPIIDASGNIISFPTSLNIQLFLLPFLVIVSMGLLQLFLSLFIRPLYSFCVTVFIMLASSYYMHPILIGNYAMILRSNLLVENGMDDIVGILLTAVIALVSIVMGTVLFRHYDILNKE